jgi:hypothetical protein
MSVMEPELDPVVVPDLGFGEVVVPECDSSDRNLVERNAKSPAHHDRIARRERKDRGWKAVSIQPGSLSPPSLTGHLRHAHYPVTELPSGRRVEDPTF